MTRDQFNDFLIQSIPMLRRYCRKLCNYHQDNAEDLVQTTLLKALTGKLQYDDHPERWIMRIAKNERINIIIRNELHASRSLDLMDHFISHCYQEHSRDLMYYETILKSLTIRKGEILLQHFEGYSYKELADIEHLTMGSIKNRIHDARTEFALKVSYHE